MPVTASAQLSLSPLFSSNAVLQRDTEVPIWGMASPLATISVKLNEQAYSTTADADGNWHIPLPAQPAGGPHRISIRSGEASVALENILFGDVWLCSGQSNMEWPAVETRNWEQESKKKADLNIRHFDVPNTDAKTPQAELEESSWQSANWKNAANFTAVGFYFARYLRQHQGVPIGLINSSWGGSRIEAWMSAETLKSAGVDANGIEQSMIAQIQARNEALQEQFPGLTPDSRSEGEGITPWWSAQLEEADWKDMIVPGLWEEQGCPGFDGTAWYRTTIELTAEEAKKAISLNLARIDDTDWVWVNGTQVGHIEQEWNTVRTYTVGPKILKAGKNVIAIKVEDTGGGGGIHGSPEEAFAQTSTRKISLAGKWKFKLDAMLPANSSLPVHQMPARLYNQMIYPLLRFPVKGVLWYQGESNANNAEESYAYRDLFEAMINGWRADWDQPELPFLFVQLANFRAADKTLPAISNWAILRESQSAALSLPNTAQALAIDIGEADDIHPRNKKDVGKRLGLAARHIVYGEEVVHSGPVYKEHTIKNSKVYLTFDHTDGGLQTKDDAKMINGFAIAGPDRQYVWAKSKIEGEQVVVWSEKVKQPQSIRYGWADNPGALNLYNTAGLPACPFRAGK